MYPNGILNSHELLKFVKFWKNHHANQSNDELLQHYIKMGFNIWQHILS